MGDIWGRRRSRDIGRPASSGGHNFIHPKTCMKQSKHLIAIDSSRLLEQRLPDELQAVEDGLTNIAELRPL